MSSKITIIGAGSVGSTIAYTLSNEDIACLLYTSIRCEPWKAAGAVKRRRSAPDHGRPRQRPDLYRNGPHQRTGAAPCVLTVYEGERPSGDEGHLRCDRRIRCRELRRKNAGGNDRNIDPGIVEIRKRWRFQLRR